MGLYKDTTLINCLGQPSNHTRLREVFRGKKKLLNAVIRGIDKTGEDVNTWTFNKDTITLPGFNAAFEIWQLWRLSGQWPLGDWLKQPLSLLAKISAIDMVYWTWKELRHKDKQQERPRGLASMNATQLAIVKAFENE